jgi:hypothetical protein
MKDKIKEIYENCNDASNCPECGNHALDLFYDKIYDLFSDLKQSIEERIKENKIFQKDDTEWTLEETQLFWSRKNDTEYLKSLLKKLQ